MKKSIIAALMMLVCPSISHATVTNISCSAPVLIAEQIPSSPIHLLYCSGTSYSTSCGDFAYLDDTNKTLIAAILTAQASGSTVTIIYDNAATSMSDNAIGWTGTCKVLAVYK